MALTKTHLWATALADPRFPHLPMARWCVEQAVPLSDKSEPHSHLLDHAYSLPVITTISSPISRTVFTAPSESIPRRPATRTESTCTTMSEAAHMLYQACASGDIASVSGLLVAGADPNGLLNSSSPLIAASANAHVEIIFLLLERMADVNSSSACRSRPLVAAVRKSSLRAVEALLDAKEQG